jgi:protein-tyrosine phosphatase
MPTPEVIRDKVTEVNDALAAEGLPLVVSPGAEIAVPELSNLGDDDLRALALGGSNTLLIESPYVDAVPFLDQMLFDLQTRGFRVLMAHPERSPMFLKDPDQVVALADREILFSVTAGSLAGRFGRRVRSFALELVQHELVHNVSSDAHDTRKRPPGLSKGFSRADPLLPGISSLASWLTEGVPAALLGNAALPPYPAVGLKLSRRVGIRLRKG